MLDEVALDSESVTSEPELASEKSESKQEKMIPVSRVEELVKKAKLKGADKMKEELETLRAENDAFKNGQMQQVPATNPQATQASMGGMAAPVDVEAIKKQIFSELENKFKESQERRAQEELENTAKQIYDQYNSKMSSGKEAFEDFDTVMKDFNPSAFPNLVYLAAQIDNTPAVMYELMKNPTKLTSVVLMSERDPQAAQNMLGRISESIKANELAKAQEKNTAEPLKRLSSSNFGQDDGKPDLEKFKQMFRK